MSTLQTGVHYPISIKALPTSWEAGYVGDFALEIQPGFASGKHNKEGRGIPHLRPFNIDRLGKLDLATIKYVARDSDAKRLHSGDVLFNNTNSPELIGKTSVVTAAGEWGFSNHMTRIVFSDDVSPRFAAYQLHYLWMSGYFLYNCVKHVNQASVSSKTLARSVPFVKPPRPQQERIVAEIEKQFSRLDEAVANLKRVKVNLKRYKATVLKAAVERKLTEDWRKQHPDVEPASKLLERILSERRAKLNNKGKYKEPTAPHTTDCPPLPNKWTWASIEQIAPVVYRYPTFFGMEHLTKGVPVIRGEHILPGYRISTDWDDYWFVAPDISEKYPKTIVGPGDIVMSVRGSVGKLGIVNEKLDGAQVSPNCLRIAILQEHILPKWFVIVFDSSFGKRSVKENVNQTTIETIKATVFIKISIPLPPVSEQQSLVAEVERRLSVIEELESAIEANLKRADSLRRTVLRAVFRGKLALDRNGFTMAS